MRVLIDYRPALRERTGVGEWVHSLVSALAAREPDERHLELHLFSSSWKDRPAANLPLPIVDCRVPVRVLNYCWHRLEWPPVEWLASQGFDVVHSPHPLLIPSTQAARVVTIHDLDFLDHPERVAGEVRRDYPALVRAHVRRADHVVVPSRFTAEAVQRRLGVPPDRLTVCYNGAPSWSPRAAWPEAGFILFVGSLGPRKNIPGLLEAYRLLLDRSQGVPPLVLAGPATAQAVDWLDALEAPPLAGHVEWLGYLERDQLHRLYQDAAVLVLPSLHEGFGLPVVEAMTVGVPVVTSDRGALPEVVDEAGLIVDPTRPADLAEAIHRMLTDLPFARACVERGHQQASRFSWRSSASALLEAYRKARRAHRPARAS